MIKIKVFTLKRPSADSNLIIMKERVFNKRKRTIARIRPIS